MDFIYIVASESKLTAVLVKPDLRLIWNVANCLVCPGKRFQIAGNGFWVRKLM